MTPCHPSSSWPGALLRCTVVRLDERRPMRYRLRANDILHSDSGTVWGTVDGQAEDVIVDPGRPHRVRSDVEMLVISLGGPALLTVVSQPEAPRNTPSWWQRMGRRWSIALRTLAQPA